MDPLTLFALANGAVSAVKAGCKLYKDIKGAAGEVKEVLKDLDDQFAKLHPPEKPATVTQRNQFIEEKNRVIELNKKGNQGEHTGVYQEIGEHLGAYYDNFYKCMAIMEEEERRAENEVYTGDASLGKRALQRVLMRKQLEQMSVDCALYTEVEAMMKHMGQTQRVLVSKQMQRQRIEESRRKQRIQRMYTEIALGVGALVICTAIGLTFSLVIEDRIRKYPQYGTNWIPRTEEQRKKDLEPQIYVGR